MGRFRPQQMSSVGESLETDSGFTAARGWGGGGAGEGWLMGKGVFSV